MEYKKVNAPILEFTNEAGTQVFKGGDAVICFTKSKIYTGTIVAFSNYKENEDADPQCSVYIDTSKNKIRSCEIIKIADITYMCRIPMGDLVGYPRTNENLDRSNFTDMIVGLGYDKEKAEFMYDGMKEFIALYNIPLSTVLASIIQEVNLSADRDKQDELVEISSKLMGAMVQVFQTTTEVIRKSQEEYIASQSGHVDACAGE